MSIQDLQAEVKKIRAENDQLRPSLKETQEKLVALENYTRRENLRFMNIPEARDENCWDIVYDIIENELKISTEDIRFHAVPQHEIENLRNITKYVKFRKVEDTALRSCYKDA